MLIMTNNNIQDLADIEQLSGMQTLEMISLLHNPVVSRPNYRLFVIHKFSNLKVLDFRKVKMKERQAASQLFKTKRGKDQLKEIEKKAKTFVPGGNLPAGTVLFTVFLQEQNGLKWCSRISYRFLSSV